MPNLYDHSEPGCLFTVLFDTLPLVLTYLSFVQEINPSFDVFNIFREVSFFTWRGGLLKIGGDQVFFLDQKGGSKGFPN